MSKLYEITERYQNLEMIWDNADENLKEILLSSLEEIKEEFNEKALNLVKYIKNIESDIDGFKAEEERLATRRKSLENQKESIKEYLYTEMVKIGQKKADLGLFKLNIQNNPASVNVIDEKLIDKKYLIEQEPKIDKKAILNDLKNNVEVKGCKIKRGESLRIK